MVDTAIKDGILASPALGTDKLPISRAGLKNILTVGDLLTFVEVNLDALSKALIIDSNNVNTNPILTLSNTAGDMKFFRIDAVPEGVITGSIGDVAIDSTDGSMYFKSSGTATNTGWRRMTPDIPTYRSSTISTKGLGVGIFYSSGHYDFSSTDANLTQASTTQTTGVINEPSATHTSLIAGGAGSATGGTGAVEITVTGTSITEAGVRTTGDSEIIVPDITAMSTDQYFETSKKWIGQVIYTLKNASGSTQTTFSADFNYGHCKYTDMGDRNFTITNFSASGLAGANDSGFNLRLLKHSSAGWTYAATGFTAGNGAICSLASDYGAESVLSNGDDFAYDRAELNASVEGSGSEGFIIELTTGSNNSIEYLNASVGVLFD